MYIMFRGYYKNITDNITYVYYKKDVLLYKNWCENLNEV